jgi:hypothetical protein
MKVDAARSGVFLPGVAARTGTNSCGSDLVLNNKLGLATASFFINFSYGP